VVILHSEHFPSFWILIWDLRDQCYESKLPMTSLFGYLRPCTWKVIILILIFARGTLNMELSEFTYIGSLGHKKTKWTINFSLSDIFLVKYAIFFLFLGQSTIKVCIKEAIKILGKCLF
jgi:hypothetical protein